MTTQNFLKFVKTGNKCQYYESDENGKLFFLLTSQTQLFLVAFHSRQIVGTKVICANLSGESFFFVFCPSEGNFLPINYLSNTRQLQFKRDTV